MQHLDMDMSPEVLVQHVINSRNNSGQSPLTFAALYDRPENVKKLVEMVRLPPRPRCWYSPVVSAVVVTHAGVLVGA